MPITSRTELIVLALERLMKINEGNFVQFGKNSRIHATACTCSRASMSDDVHPFFLADLSGNI